MKVTLQSIKYIIVFQTKRSWESPEWKNPRRHFFVTFDLTFDLLIQKSMGFQESWWNISMSRLVILAAAVVEISCRKKDRQTEKHP